MSNATTLPDEDDAQWAAVLPEMVDLANEVDQFCAIIKGRLAEMEQRLAEMEQRLAELEQDSGRTT